MNKKAEISPVSLKSKKLAARSKLNLKLVPGSNSFDFLTADREIFQHFLFKAVTGSFLRQYQIRFKANSFQIEYCRPVYYLHLNVTTVKFSTPVTGLAAFDWVGVTKGYFESAQHIFSKNQ